MKLLDPQYRLVFGGGGQVDARGGDCERSLVTALDWHQAPGGAAIPGSFRFDTKSPYDAVRHSVSTQSRDHLPCKGHRSVLAVVREMIATMCKTSTIKLRSIRRVKSGTRTAMSP